MEGFRKTRKMDVVNLFLVFLINSFLYFFLGVEIDFVFSDFRVNKLIEEILRERGYFDSTRGLSFLL